MTAAEHAGPPVDTAAPTARIARLLDRGSTALLHEPDDSGVQTARGRVDGVPTIVYATDPGRMGGALGAAGCRHLVAAIDTAVAEGSPVIGLWHSGGARLTDGAAGLDGVGHLFAAQVRASGRVPQISVVLGPAAGGAAYGPALTDVVVMAPAGRVLVTGPDVVHSVTGERIDQESLGGPEAHGRRSGVVHVVADSEDDALVRARRLTALLTRPGLFDLSTGPGPVDPGSLLPERPQRAYDVRPLVAAVLDGGATWEELQAGYARNVVTGLGRLGGHTVGVVANNPLRLGGCLDSPAAEKAARFVRFCDAFAVPLVVLVDVPGYLPGVTQEWEGVVRRGAKLLHAFAEAVVPRVTVVLRKSYGGAYIAMNSRALGATSVLAWPDAEISVMGPVAAVRVLNRREIAAAPEPDREAVTRRLAAELRMRTGGLEEACTIGAVDEVVEPSQTRRRIVHALATAPARRGRHANIPL
ncbi:acetyl-CoA/propionyl-CoA carboxylase carboxyl transferase subunit [Pseudonocardia endophytica]|uniref:Acetyl-CoA/propionyl-CoA carboxylase carboxyl transferase subunit n=1 Tax=Pseudonocardia endophytica TaxID=401976 RepID=A0A4R1HPF5_PSEEN|nr:carboxyl transferase domain-containing protein [Pseudonocardia endophytica]TCK22280.1 acetyl-CoA/propionyl-CoA carboxylase carboxyl transferase subunit [Pseudonocardia endophytica]